MLLEPGPIPTLSVDFTLLDNPNPGFGDMVDTFNILLDYQLGLMDALIAIGAVIDATLPPDGAQADVDSLGVILNAYPGVDTTADQATGDSQLSDLEQKMLIAYAVIPGEAFEVVPQSLETPPGQPVVNQASTSYASINNLTRPGDTNFYPGDQYEIDVTLEPVVGGGGAYQGVDVQLYPAQDGTMWPIVDLCLTDQNGNLSAVGTFQQADIGSWTVTVAYTDPQGNRGIGGGDVAALNTYLNFTVSPAPINFPPIPPAQQTGGGGLHPVQTVGAPCATGQPVTVQLANNVRPGATDFFTGETWTLTITGPANSDVLISALWNGQPLPWTVLGQTDANGNFTLQGPETTGYVGTWVEYYQVGAIPWNGTLDFAVQASPVAPPNIIYRGS